MNWLRYHRRIRLTEPAREQHDYRSFYFSFKSIFENEFISCNYRITSYIELAKGITFKAISACIIYDKIWFKSVKCFIKTWFNLIQIFLISDSLIGDYVNCYGLFGILILRENTMIICIHNEVFFLIHMISFMSIALMNVKIDDHKSFQPKPLFHVVCDEGDVGIDAYSFWSRTCTITVMKSTTKIDWPTVMISNICSFYWTKCLCSLRIKYSGSQ